MATGFGSSSVGEGRQDLVEPFSPLVWEKEVRGGSAKGPQKTKIYNKKGYYNQAVT